MLPIAEVVVVGRSTESSDRFAAAWAGRFPTVAAGTAEQVADADVVVCATTAIVPLFPADLLPDDALAIAVGSHQPGVVELDPKLLGRAQVVVEEPATALREAGEVVAAVSAGVLDRFELVGLSDLVQGALTVGPDATARVQERRNGLGRQGRRGSGAGPSRNCGWRPCRCAGGDRMSTVPAEAVLDPAGLQLPDLGGRVSLRQQVTEALRGAVVSGVMRAGELYPLRVWRRCRCLGDAGAWS